ncbi:unnamed protein product, partial [Prorocentrum cordatum]
MITLTRRESAPRATGSVSLWGDTDEDTDEEVPGEAAAGEVHVGEGVGGGHQTLPELPKLSECNGEDRREDVENDKAGAAAGPLAATGQRVAQAAAKPNGEPAQQDHNSYLNGIDFGAAARAASQRPPSAAPRPPRRRSARPQSGENPYLKATGLVASAQQAAPAQQAAAPAEAAAPAQQAPPPAAAQHQNSYLKDIGLAEAKHAVSQ